MNDLQNGVVLLVEDDLGDQKLIKMALANSETPCRIQVAASGEEALEYLKRNRGDPSQSLPRLILLDLNMPGMGGREFLRQIKMEPQLCHIPTVILTTSDSKTDIEQCYRLQASGYIQKPSSIMAFNEVVRKLAKYWFMTSILVKNSLDNPSRQTIRLDY